MSDERNPEYIFNMTHTELLTKIVKGEIDPVALARKQLRNRGLDDDGIWQGFNRGE
jgi:hypothetical protein